MELKKQKPDSEETFVYLGLWLALILAPSIAIALVFMG